MAAYKLSSALITKIFPSAQDVQLLMMVAWQVESCSSADRAASDALQNVTSVT